MSRKLDALFAEKVLGWTIHPCTRHGDCDAPCSPEHLGFHIPHFGIRTDWALHRVDKYFLFHVLKVRNGEWCAMVEKDRWARGYGATPALAVVKARLLAAGVSEEEIEEALCA